MEDFGVSCFRRYLLEDLQQGLYPGQDWGGDGVYPGNAGIEAGIHLGWGTLESPSQLPAWFWKVEGNRRTQRKPTLMKNIQKVS